LQRLSSNGVLRFDLQRRSYDIASHYASAVRLLREHGTLPLLMPRPRARLRH